MSFGTRYKLIRNFTKTSRSLSPQWKLANWWNPPRTIRNNKQIFNNRTARQTVLGINMKIIMDFAWIWIGNWMQLYIICKSFGKLIARELSETWKKLPLSEIINFGTITYAKLNIVFNYVSLFSLIQPEHQFRLFLQCVLCFHMTIGIPRVSSIFVHESIYYGIKY